MYVCDEDANEWSDAITTYFAIASAVFSPET